MPPTRKSHTAQHHFPASSRSRNLYDFPDDHHLLIITPSLILAWDRAGLHPIFRSSSSGIVAAREARNGSNVLAVADQRVVVLHDTTRGQERSWGLHADDDQVRHLEYTPDAKTLFMSTTLTNDVQQYSLEQSRLMSPTQIHSAPPIALAVSSSGHLMLSASDNPPVLYLRSLSHDSAPILIEPQASDAPVTVATFHPERPNIFLLAFRDGTLAAYDSSEITRNAQGRSPFSNQERVNDGEIAHLDNVHRTTTKIVTKDSIGVKATSITAAAFLPGYKTRAVSTGSDGRCRLVDFAEGGIVLRTWHAKAPVTSVSVLSVKLRRGQTTYPTSNAPRVVPIELGEPTSTNNHIALGRSDGKVHIYDSVGLLVAQKSVGKDAERIIGVEWVKGQSPQPLHGGPLDCSVNKVLARAAPSTSRSDREFEAQQNGIVKVGSDPIPQEHLGLPWTLKRTGIVVSGSVPTPPRRFTVHPDEMKEGSVRYTPRPNKPVPQLSVPAAQYLDLFSPVKSSAVTSSEPSKKLIASLPRARPRVSSRTFVKQPGAGAEQGLPFAAKNGPQVPTHEADANIVDNIDQHGNQRRTSTNASPFSRKPRSVFQLNPLPVQTQQIPTVIPSNENAKILADIRKLSSKHHTGAVLAPFASAEPLVQTRPAHPSSRPAKRMNYLRKHRMHVPARQKAWSPGNVLEREAAFVTDSNQDRSSDELEEDEGQQQTDNDGTVEDIWLSSGNEGVFHQPHTRRYRPPRLKSASPRAKIHPLRKNPPLPSSSIYSQAARLGIDRSTEDDMATAHTHLSPERGLSPSSKDISDLFPRSSSLSPQRHAKSCNVAVSVRSQGVVPTMSQVKSPWSRVRSGKPQRHAEKPAVEVKLVRSPTKTCFTCVSNNHRIKGLEGEVVRLKGEVLALKVVLRREGLSVSR